jgi:hypothetical protein
MTQHDVAIDMRTGEFIIMIIRDMLTRRLIALG